MALLVPPGVKEMVPPGMDVPISKLISPSLVEAVILFVRETSMASPAPVKKLVTVPILPVNAAVAVSEPASTFSVAPLPSTMPNAEWMITVSSAPSKVLSTAPLLVPAPPRAVIVPFSVTSPLPPVLSIVIVSPLPPRAVRRSPTDEAAFPPEALMSPTDIVPEVELVMSIVFAEPPAYLLPSLTVSRAFPPSAVRVAAEVSILPLVLI